MYGPFAPITLETFGGLCDTPDRNDVPPWMGWRAENCAWKPGSLEKRPGFTAWFTQSQGSLCGVFQWSGPSTATNPSGRELVMALSSGSYLLVGRDASGAANIWLAGGEAACAAAAVPVFATSHDKLCVAVSNGNRPATFGGVVRYSGGDFPWPLWWPTYTEPPVTAPSLTLLTGGGSMTAGSHTVWFTYELVDAAMSPPTPPAYLTVGSNDRISATVSPGSTPLSAVAALCWCSPAGDSQNGYLVERRDVFLGPPTFVISSSDGVLTTGEKADFPALRRIAAPICPAGVFGPYKGRMCYLGAPHRYYPGAGATGRSKNTTFEYGAQGWETPAAGGSFQPRRYRITFDGVASTRGLLRNTGTVVNDFAGRCVLYDSRFTSARWGVRVFARRSANLVNASLRCGVRGVAEQVATDISASAIGTAWTLVETGTSGASSGPQDFGLFVEGIGPGVANEWIEVGLEECYDPGSRDEDQVAWWSQPALPREVDLTWGPVVVASGASSGQKLRFAFELGGRWFYVLEKSIWVTMENGAEPSAWPVELVSEGMGTPSYRGVGVGPDWAVIAGPAGCWLFTGGALSEEADLSREIKGTWNRIAWGTAGHLVWVQVLPELRQVWVGVPLDGASVVSHILVLDYTDGLGSGVSNGGVGRRWSVWSRSSPSCAIPFMDSAGKTRTLISSGSKVLFRDDTVRDDEGVGVEWTWESGPIGLPEGGLSLYRRLLVSAEGYGTLGLALVKASTELVSLISPTLYSPRRGDQTVLVHLVDEKVAIRFGQGATPGTWARIVRAALWMMRRPFARVRLQNP